MNWAKNSTVIRHVKVSLNPVLFILEDMTPIMNGESSAIGIAVRRGRVLPFPINPNAVQVNLDSVSWHPCYTLQVGGGLNGTFRQGSNVFGIGIFSLNCKFSSLPVETKRDNTTFFNSELGRRFEVKPRW